MLQVDSPAEERVQASETPTVYCTLSNFLLFPSGLFMLSFQFYQT